MRQTTLDWGFSVEDLAARLRCANAGPRPEDIKRFCWDLRLNRKNLQTTCAAFKQRAGAKQPICHRD